ncbi:MAG: major capsid protein [Microvirus sp.]|nr:MAG: major capsid protein [Microvirus sp.]
MPVNVNRKSPDLSPRPEFLGNRNRFDMCQNHQTTMTMGKLYPVYTKPTLPGDTWTIQGEFMFRFAPLYLPIMHHVWFNVDYYYVPNRILWPGRVNAWEEWIRPGNENIGYSAPWIESPYSGLTGSQLLIEYMGFPTALNSETGSVIVNALPISCYLMIWDDFYRNDQITSAQWFPLVSGDNTTEFENAWEDISGSLVIRPLRRLWSRDNYTSMTPTPQIGGDVLIPLVRPWDDTTNMLQTWRSAVTGDPVAAGDVQTDSSGYPILNTAGVQIYLDPNMSAATIRELRYNEMLTLYLERAMRTGDRYPDYLESFWESNPFYNIIDRPVRIAGKKGKVVVSEVLSTAETTAAQSYVGSYSGQAMMLEASKTIHYTCPEHGWIMAICSVIPQSAYMQGLDPFWEQWVSSMQYPLEQFALIGDEAVPKKEVAYDYEDTQFGPSNNETFGYRPKYSVYRHSNDIYSGLMRSTFLSFHLGRIFNSSDIASGLALNTEFITCVPRITDVFRVAENEDEIYAWIYHEAFVTRRLPKYGIPVK